MRTKKTVKLTGSRKRKLCRLLFEWYRGRQRDLPWRKTKDPYRVLVSEVMLQQTQVNHVVGKYREFLTRFPTIRWLASASTSEVIRAWSGLGYNVRALRLQKVAQEVVGKFKGRVPDDPELLERLPGIGRYTANAIASFAYQHKVPVVDTNIHRVISRLFFRLRSSDQRISDSFAWQIAKELLPDRRSRDWTLALMDLGSTICTGQNPRCVECPMSKVCKSAFRVDGRRIRKPKLRTEPSHDGIPNRLYRGRIVEVLRNLNGENRISLRNLGRRIKISFDRSEEVWLRGLLEHLERDGLVKMTSHGSRVQVSLP